MDREVYIKGQAYVVEAQVHREIIRLMLYIEELEEKLDLYREALNHLANPTLRDLSN